MILEQFFDQTSSTYTYLIAQKAGSEAIIIDPVEENCDQYLKFIGERKLRLIAALDTHVHADHISGLKKLRDLTLCMTLMGEASKTDLVSRRLADGEVIRLGDIELKTFYTPGHTDDSYSFLFENYLFTGDTMLIRSNGRTDFQNGSPSKLYESLQRLFELPNETIVLPGHDYKGENYSTIGREKVENPRFAGRTREEFISIMENLNLPDPKLMDIAVPANLSMAGDLKQKIAKDWLVSAEELEANRKNWNIIDLREPEEIAKTGTIEGAKKIAYTQLAKEIDSEDSEISRLLKGDKRNVFYCAHGERSALALKIVSEKGMTNIGHLDDGISMWIDSGHNLVKN